MRLCTAVAELLGQGHAGAILVNADSPTLPAAILRAAVEAVGREDAVVLGPAIDGGYTLIGLSRPHAHVFSDIPWSTPHVHRLTHVRASEIGVPVVDVPRWYDVDDGETLQLLEAELRGEPLPFAQDGMHGAEAAATRRFLEGRRMPRLGGAAW